MKIIPSNEKLSHFIASFQRKAAVEDFVRIRKRLCDFMSALHTKVLMPICGACYSCKVHLMKLPIEPPHICADTWKDDLAWEVGLDEKEIKEIEEKIQNDEGVEFFCSNCRVSLEYGQDDFYVESEFFEEHFDIPESTYKNPSKQLKKQIEGLYGKRCYGCGKKLIKRDISNDHIVARVHGGLTSPLNLQILCRNCDNNIKRSRKVETINVNLTFLFRPPPSDAFEGVTW